jgi:hypothetical protein
LSKCMVRQSGRYWGRPWCGWWRRAHARSFRSTQIFISDIRVWRKGSRFGGSPSFVLGPDAQEPRRFCETTEALVTTRVCSRRPRKIQVPPVGRLSTPRHKATGTLPNRAASSSQRTYNGQAETPPSLPHGASPDGAGPQPIQSLAHTGREPLGRDGRSTPPIAGLDPQRRFSFIAPVRQASRSSATPLQGRNEQRIVHGSQSHPFGPGTLLSPLLCKAALTHPIPPQRYPLKTLSPPVAGTSRPGAKGPTCGHGSRLIPLSPSAAPSGTWEPRK